MAVNGGHPDPGASNIATNNPSGGHPPAPGVAAKSSNPAQQQDKVVLTNSNGATASTNRPTS